MSQRSTLPEPSATTQPPATTWGRVAGLVIILVALLQGMLLRPRRRSRAPRAWSTARYRGLSARRQADDELRASEERFRAIFEQAAVGMCLLDMAGRLLRTNDRFCAITGYTSDELAELALAELAHPDDRGSDENLLRQLLVGVIPTYTLEKRYLRRDATVIWVNLTV